MLSISVFGLAQYAGPESRVDRVGGALLTHDIFRSAIGLGKLFKDMDYQKGFVCCFRDMATP